MIVPAEYTNTKQLPPPKQPLVLKAFALLFSILFHPLFIPTIGILYLAFIQHGFFTGMSTHNKSKILASVAVNTIFFPLVTVLLLKGLGFIKSVYLRTQKERIIPYVASNIFYFWLFLVLKNNAEIPQIATSFVLGIFLASSVALVLNSFFKISMHALGMGALCGLLLVIIFSGFPFGTFLPLMIVILVTGIVCTSRLILTNHTMFDINSGILIAILCQMIAFIFIG